MRTRDELLGLLTLLYRYRITSRICCTDISTWWPNTEEVVLVQPGHTTRVDMDRNVVLRQFKNHTASKKRSWEIGPGTRLNRSHSEMCAGYSSYWEVTGFSNSSITLLTLPNTGLPRNLFVNLEMVHFLAAREFYAKDKNIHFVMGEHDIEAGLETVSTMKLPFKLILKSDPTEQTQATGRYYNSI